MVSFCMPTYNRSEYLAEAIESILVQSVEDWELIVQDDASTDSTPELMSYYTSLDQRIKYFRNDKNEGIAKTRNNAIKQAKGEHIAVMDSDDFNFIDRLKVALETLKKTKADVFYSSYARCDEHGKPFDGIIPTQQLDAEEIKYNQGVPHATIVAKAKCFRDHPYRDELRVNDDLALIIDWYKAGYTFCCPTKKKMADQPLYFVRFHSQSTSNTKDKEVKQITARLHKELEGVK